MSAVRRAWRWFRDEPKLSLAQYGFGVLCLFLAAFYAIAMLRSGWYGVLVPYWLFLAWWNFRCARRGSASERHHREFMIQLHRIDGMLAEMHHLDRDARQQQMRDIDAAFAELDRTQKAYEASKP